MIDTFIDWLQKPAIQTPVIAINNSSLLVGAAATVGLAGVIADAIKTRKVINETWTNEAAPGSFDRFRRQFSDARSGLKQWYKRHKKSLITIGVLGAVGAALLAPQSPFAGGKTLKEMTQEELLASITSPITGEAVTTHGGGVTGIIPSKEPQFF